MTERQDFYVGLLQQMLELDPSVQIYTDDGLALQASAHERREFGSPGNSLKCIKEPGVVEQCRLWLPSPYTAGVFTMVRAWALAGVIERPTKGRHVTGSPIVDRCRQLRDAQPGAAFYAGEAFGGRDILYFGREGYDVADAFFSVYVKEGDNSVRHCYDLAEPRTPRQELAHRLWRRPARNYGDRLYGTYNKKMFEMLLNWADEARERPEEFAVLTFGSTPVWFPKTAYVSNASISNHAAITAGGQCFFLRETPDEARAILRG